MMDAATDGRTGPRAVRRSQASHHAILVAAAAVVAEKGYFGASIEEIAARAGTGKQTIYRWWRAKPYLYLELYGLLVPMGALETDRGSLRADLVALLTRLLEHYATTPAAAVLSGLIAEAQSDPAVAEAFDAEIVRARRPLLRDPFLRARARGEIDAGFDIDFAADLFTAAVWHRLLLPQDRPAERFAELLVTSLLEQTP